MSDIVLTINGVERGFVNGSFSPSETANGISTAHFVIRTLGGELYVPPRGALVHLTEDGDPMFYGTVDTTRRFGFETTEGEYLAVEVNVVSFNALMDRRIVKLSRPVESLKARLTSLTDWLTGIGVTLDPTQEEGPTIPARDYDYRVLSEILNELMTLTGQGGLEQYVWNIDFDEKLKAFKPSSSPAPFDITPTNRHAFGDVQVEETDDGFHNHVFLRMAEKSEDGRTEVLTGNGSQTVFKTQYTIKNIIGGYVVELPAGGIAPGDNITRTIRTFGDPATWTYDSTTGELTRDAGALASGDTMSIKFDGTFAASAESYDLDSLNDRGPWETTVTVDDVTTVETAQSLADAYLQLSLNPPIKITYQTIWPGLHPGMTQHIEVPNRDIDDDVVIVDVVTNHKERDIYLRTVTAVVNTKTNLLSGWRDIYKAWLGNAAPGSSSTPEAKITGAAPPDKAIQYNDAGDFGAKSTFTFDKKTNCLVMGLDSSMDSTNLESCTILGVDCHILD